MEPTTPVTNVDTEVMPDEATPNTATDQSPKIALGHRMKAYEAATAQFIDPKLPWMVRLDGHKFSSFTKGFKKPFDDRIHNCMVATCKALMDSFHPTAVFTCSDEITMCFPALNSEEAEDSTADASGASTETNGSTDTDKTTEQARTMIFNGRIHKIETLMSGLASVAFDRALRQQTFDEATEARLIAYIDSNPPYFDSRVFNVPFAGELVNNLIWRSHYDYRRNSISQFARSYFSNAEMHCVNSFNLCEKMKAEKNVDWETDLAARYKYGSFFKRETYIKAAVVNGKSIDCPRHRIVELSFCFNKGGPQAIDFLMSKYLPEDYAQYITARHETEKPKFIGNKRVVSNTTEASTST